MPRRECARMRVAAIHPIRRTPANLETIHQGRNAHTIKEDNMNTTPKPIIRESHIRNSDGSPVKLTVPSRGDHFDISTGEVSVARIIGGVRYDTVRATLIVAKSGLDAIGTYEMRRLYRATHGAYFLLHMDWSIDEGFYGTDFIKPTFDGHVLMIARTMIAPTDCLAFLRDWYCQGWIPRDDSDAQQWAESTLSADDCEEVLLQLRNRRWRE